ncbi:hypothetical protein [Streptomyces sp. NPDC002054]|uniref:hypothetical protein n=1 Tax=Streptomyces sp. NPDC002054 TaxID=3154663 RepID=UPI0033336116
MTLPMTKTAWDHPPTAFGYRRLAMRRVVWLIGTVALGAVSCTAISYAPAPLALIAFMSIVVTGLAILPAVAIAFFRRQRVAAVLRAYPWLECLCRYPAQAAGNPTTIVVAFQNGYAPTFRIVPFPVALAETQNSHPDRIWFAGDPRFGGVVSPVGGHYPVRVVPHAPAGREWDGPGDVALARRVGLVRRSGKGTQT